MNFDTIRPMFSGHLTQAQVDGINTIFERFGLIGDADNRHLAYLLGTTKLETDSKMQPISEYGAPSYFAKYDVGTQLGKALGNTQIGDGYLYRGRGYVQVTGRANYRKFGIEGDPNDALEPEVAARILIEGCLKGMFTGKKLGDYPDFYNMRRVINGLDRAGTIAAYAETFLKALTTGD